ncbi:MAG: hypothetical protein H2057_08030 [Alphaproteobacteria bacterium]|nr:hypothetical protein [Alphaproteobacteria bacterium]
MLFWLFSGVELGKRRCQKIWCVLKRMLVDLCHYVWDHIGPLILLMLISGFAVRFFEWLICVTDWFNVSLVKTAEKPDPQVLFVCLAIFLTGMPHFTYLSFSLKHDPSKSFEGMCDTTQKIIHVKRALASTVVGLVPVCVLYILGYMFFKKDPFGYGVIYVIGFCALLYINTGFASARKNEHGARILLKLICFDIASISYALCMWEASQKDVGFQFVPIMLMLYAFIYSLYAYVTRSLEILRGIPDNSKVNNILFKGKYCLLFIFFGLVIIVGLDYAQSYFFQFIKRMQIWKSPVFRDTMIQLVFQVLVIVIEGGVLLMTKRLALGRSKDELLGEGIDSHSREGGKMFFKNTKARLAAVMLDSKIRWKKSVKKVHIHRNLADNPHPD